MERYRINFKTQFWNCWITLVYIIFFAIAYYYFICVQGDDIKIFFQFATAFFLYLFLPQLALHLNYYFINKGDELAYDKVYKDMYFTHKGKQIKFNLSDIEQVVLHKSFALHKGNIHFLPWDSYNH